MILVAFGARRSSLRQGVLFALVSLALAGLVLLVAAVFDWGLVLLHGAVYYPVCWQALLLVAALGYLITSLVLRRCAMHGGGEIEQARIETGTAHLTLPVLRDTGNTLRDPMTNAPVLIVEWQAAAPLLPARATRPDDMEPTCNAALHAENRKAFRYLLSLSESPAIWAAWGNIIEKRDYLMDCMRDFAADGQAANAQWFTAGPLLKSGHPHHPLYLKSTTALQPFDIDAYLHR